MQGMRLLGLWMIVALLSGCGGKSTPESWLETYPTTGTLTINGAPAKGAIVRLFPLEPQPNVTSPVIPTATVREDGSFELMSYQTGDGAPEGGYAVTVEWPDPKLNASKGGMPEDPPDRLKGRFTNPERSKFKVQIVPGTNQLEAITLEKAEILKGSSLQ